VDVGGKDGARIKGFLNTAMWLQAGVLSQALVWLRGATGSWAALFLAPALLQLLTTGAFCRWAEGVDYRTYAHARLNKPLLRSS